MLNRKHLKTLCMYLYSKELDHMYMFIKPQEKPEVPDNHQLLLMKHFNKLYDVILILLL